jgi:hypothetical protein
MRFSTPLASAVSVLALVSGSAAVAQVSAQEVWDNWKGNLGLYGSDGVTIGSESYDGGVLTVSDIVISISDAEGSVNATLPLVTFTEQGDGTVRVTMSEEFPISATGPASDGMGEMSVEMAVRQTGLEMVVGGTAAEMTYDITAQRYALDIDNLSDGGVTVSGSLALNDVAGSYVIATSDMQAIAYEIDAAAIELGLSIDDQIEGVTVGLEGMIDGIASSATLVLPLPENTTPETVLMDGLAAEGGYTLGAASLSFDLNQQGLPVTGTLVTSGSELGFVASAEGVGYTTTTSGLVIEGSSPMMPFPVRVSLAEYGLDLLMPLSATEDPVDFAFGINLTDLAINEEIWAMIDPASMFSHDPATLILDLTGTARLFVDLADPEQAAEMAMMGPPGEIHSLSLNDLTLAIAGAQITGAGAFTFDNSDMMTIPGVPRPEGKLDLQANGVNQLIDTLTAMGLLPQEQVMGARMMLGLFTVPVGDDQLTSTLEINAEGHILANGQRLQ